MQKVVIMTAIPVERKAVLAHLTDLYEDVHPSGTIYHKGVFVTEKDHWEVAVVRMGIGNIPTAQTAQQAIDYLSPKILLLVGVAGGLKDVSPGDVVAANKIYLYASGKAGVNFYPRPEVRLSAHSLVQRAQVVAENGEWQQRIQGLPRTVLPKAYVGALAAGEQVLSSIDSEIWKLLKNNYSDALAVEMEGFGALVATHVNWGVEAIVIRGISDTIDNKSDLDKEGFQYVAACHASAFAFEMLARLVTTQKDAEGAISSQPPKNRSHLTSIAEERGKNTVIVNGSIGKGSAVGSNPVVYNYPNDSMDDLDT